ncbi:MAG: NAD-dependent epimerase/dehydratase family protein, partial [Candidatus Limnocylindrales bacterium]
HAVRNLWFASSGVVYGRPQRVPTAEGDGPLFPESHYAAAKLAGEAIISGFAHLYDWRAMAFRFGNTVGGRSDHGVVHDFVVKLMRDPSRLEILGDGNQAKPYIDVTDLVGAIRHAGETPLSRPMGVLNVGPSGTLTVRQVALIVLEALDLATADVEFSFTADSASRVAGWPGDTALVEFDTAALDALGWRPAIAPEDAVHAAARAIAARYRSTGAALLTTAERRALARERVPALHA